MLNSFSSIFEVFGVLNLSYAGSSIFRDVVNYKILRLKESISTSHKTKIKQRKAEIYAVMAEEQQVKLLHKIELMDRYFKLNTQKIIQLEEKERKFVEGIKSIFLIVSIYSFFALIIGGYEQFYENNEINKFIAFINLNLITVIILFIRNFIPKYTKSNVRTVFIAIFFTFPIILYLIFIKLHISFLFSDKYFPDERLNILVSLLITFSAFLLHLFRAFFHRIYFRFQLYKIYRITGRELSEIEKTFKMIQKSGKRFIIQHKSIDFFINLWYAIRKEKNR